MLFALSGVKNQVKHLQCFNQGKRTSRCFLFFFRFAVFQQTANRTVHDYFGVDLEIIWQVVCENLLELKRQIVDLLGK